MTQPNRSVPAPYYEGPVTGPVSARLNIGGAGYINFYGSAYLALSGLPAVRDAVASALARGVPFAKQVPAALGVLDAEFDEVERTGAAFFGSETSLYLPSGYLIGMALAAAVARDFGHVYLDEYAHYSLGDAAKLTGLPVTVLPHCDPTALADALTADGARPLVMTDGVFATTGRVAPLADYARTIAAWDGRLLIDESHAFGVVGEGGRGAAEHCGVEDVAYVGATLSKAFCAHGALLPCSHDLLARLRATPPVRGACAGSALSGAAASAGLRHATAHPHDRAHIGEVANHLRSRLRDLGIVTLDTPSAIVSFEIGRRADMLALRQRAWDRGICLYHSTYLGAGPEGMIRCGIFRDHELSDVDALIDILASL